MTHAPARRGGEAHGHGMRHNAVANARLHPAPRGVPTRSRHGCRSDRRTDHASRGHLGATSLGRVRHRRRRNGRSAWVCLRPTVSAASRAAAHPTAERRWQERAHYPCKPPVAPRPPPRSAVQIRPVPSTTRRSLTTELLRIAPRSTREPHHHQDADVSTTPDDPTDRQRRANALVGGGNGDVSRVTEHGRDYLVFPVVAAREMVLNYPEHGRKEFLPEESFAETAELWAGQPITAGHPEGKTATTPDAYTGETYGQVHEPDASDSKLVVNAWVDVARAEDIGGAAAEVVERLESGQEVAVSTGYATTGDRRVNGTYDGEQYDLEQGTVIPDHLAMFPPDEYRARCSLEDGCGAPRANAVIDPALHEYAGEAAPGRDVDDTTDMNDDEPIDPSLAHRVLGRLGYGGSGAAAPHVNAGHEHEDCHCDGTCDDCRENASESSGDAGDDPSDGDGEESTDADADPDGGDPSDDQTNMSNDLIDTLAEQTAFSRDQLSDWEESDLDTLEETMDVETDVAPDADADGASAGAATAKQNAQPDDDPADDDSELEELVRENAESIGDLTEAVEDLKQNYVESEHEDDIRAVVNSVDDMTEDDARTLAEQNPEALASLASEHRDEEQRANYAAVPGPKNRSPDTGSEDVDDIPAGTRTDYEARTGGD